MAEYEQIRKASISGNERRYRQYRHLPDVEEQGYEIVGLTMWVWGDEPVEARNLADSMGIEHHVADEREAFRQIIVQNFIDEYRRGVLPILV